jgi:Putative MetA-pathway of phenol degradation
MELPDAFAADTTAFSRAFSLACAGSLLLLCVATPCAGQAGPPYQTDDPDPVPYHHFEAYVFESSDRTSAGTSLSAPSFEMNWGAAPNLQLHLVVPFVTSFTAGTPGQHGIGDIELGAKYRFIKETTHTPEVGVFPFVELPAGDALRGLGVGTTWYRFPVWIKKSAGAWNTFGGGGEVLVHADGYKNYPFASGLLQRKVNEQLTLGGELVGHGAESPDATGIGRSIMADFGGFYSFTPGVQMLFAAGHSIAWHRETYTYLALNWTWGKDVETNADRRVPMPFRPFKHD